jgi:hypothetical protein
MGEDDLGSDSSETPMTTTPSMGEDKPEPAPEQKKRVLPKKPAKRPNDDNIAGMYKELNKQIAKNANDSIKK